MMYYYADGYPSHMFGYGFGWVLVFVCVLAIVYALFGQQHGSWRHGHDESGGSRTGALDILKERYAKGEITKEVYDAMKKDLL
jgi:putative membrane protein